jgi:hypothetical protein
MTTETITYQQVTDIAMTLPTNRLRSLYDFALFLKSQLPVPAPAPFTDIFGETEAEIEASEEEWSQLFASNLDKLRTLGQQAGAEFRASRTKPMEFTPEGRLAR